MEYEIYKDGELYHWGIKGMRWGVRRYQNKDGSLTNAGKKRIREEQAKIRQEEQTLKNRKAVKAKLDRLEARKKAVEEGKKELDDDTKLGGKGKKGSSTDTSASAKKSIKDMSDDELMKAVNRSRLEEQYRMLNPEPPAKQSMMKKMINDVVLPAATNSGKKFLENALNKAAENALKGKADPNSLDALKKTYEKLDLQKKIEKLKKGAEGDDLSVEDQGKKMRLQWEKDDRDARSRGYQNAPDEANQKRQAAAAEAARKANEARSNEYYNSTYNTSKVKYSTEHVKAGKTETTSAMKALPSSVSNLPSTTVNTGRSRVNDLLDRDGNVIMSWSDDD